MEFYANLFFLWLLYRFMKPQTILKDGMTEASALFLAHDDKLAKKILIDWHTGEEEKRKNDNLQKKH